jgi:hypothetical protein
MIDFNISNKLTDDLIINNDLLFVLQQIDLLFDTDINDVLGDSSFGTNYDKYLYTLGVSNISLETKIISDLNKLDLCGFKPEVTVKIIEGTQRDIAFIDITLKGNYKEYNKTYVIK